MCEYCVGSKVIEIKEAYNKDKLVNEEIEICIDDDILSIDYETKEASGFYIPITFCPFCGEKL